MNNFVRANLAFIGILIGFAVLSWLLFYHPIVIVAIFAFGFWVMTIGNLGGFD